MLLMNNPADIFSAAGTAGVSMFTAPVMILISFIAGIIASLSPCTLGMLPLITGYIGGYSKTDSRRLFIQMIFFSLGLSCVLSITGAACAAAGRAFTSAAPPAVIMIFGSIIVILGLNLLEVLDIQFPAFIKKLPQNKNNGLFIFPFLIGAVFALAASPCAAPILAAIMAFAAVSSNILFSIALLFSFSIGQCIIIIIFAMAANALKNAGRIAKYSGIAVKICGLLLVLSGVYIWYSMFQ